MSMAMRGQVDMEKLLDHYRRVCKRNLRAKCKCCAKCPFIGFVRTIAQYDKEVRCGK